MNSADSGQLEIWSPFSSPATAVWQAATVLSDEHLRVLGWSEDAEHLLGWKGDRMLGNNLADLAGTEEERQRLLGLPHQTECLRFWARTADGQRMPVDALAKRLQGLTERLILVRLSPIAGWQGARESLQSRCPGRPGAGLELKFQKDFEALFAHHPDGVFAANRQRRLVCANSALASMTGHALADISAMPLTALFAPDQAPLLQQAFSEAIQGKPQSLEVQCLRSDGTILEASLTILPHMADHGIAGLHGIVKDISQRKRDEQRILYLANHDAVTGLPNRNLLHDRMQHAIDQARRGQRQLGVLFMDLDRFKVINDSLGHDQGDLLLRTVAERLSGAVREGDTVARLGGDEFVVMLEDIDGPERSHTVAAHLLAAVARPVDLAGTTVTVSASIGAAIYPFDGQDAVTLLKNADLAMYAAKDGGVGKCCRYHEDMNARAVARLMRESSLRRAIDHRQLLLHYQPRLEIGSRRLAGMEALVRWDHPERGLVYPSYFIELAEETGMIDGLGEWVIYEACRQYHAWREEGLAPPRVSVNVSALQLRSTRICATVRAALDAFALEPDWLELEITETSLMQNLDLCSDRLAIFRELGVKISIDDFGSGYSSLSYLKRLPIDVLKIDKSFIRDLAEDNDDGAIVHATIAMAHSMGMRVVAEGVASLDQLDFLEKARCDEIQGYLFCQPLPPDEMEGFFRTLPLRGIYCSLAG